MRIGSGKIIEQTSGDWHLSQVGARAQARVSAIREAMSPQRQTTRAIWQAQLLAAKALDELRNAYYHEANEDGPYQQAILDTQTEARVLMAGCEAMLKEMAK